MYLLAKILEHVIVEFVKRYVQMTGRYFRFKVKALFEITNTVYLVQ